MKIKNTPWITIMFRNFGIIYGCLFGVLCGNSIHEQSTLAITKHEHNRVQGDLRNSLLIAAAQPALDFDSMLMDQLIQLPDNDALADRILQHTLQNKKNVLGWWLTNAVWREFKRIVLMKDDVWCLENEESREASMVDSMIDLSSKEWIAYQLSKSDSFIDEFGGIENSKNAQRCQKKRRDIIARALLRKAGFFKEGGQGYYQCEDGRRLVVSSDRYKALRRCVRDRLQCDND